jgi:peptide/nickel transport system permease protein
MHCVEMLGRTNDLLLEPHLMPQFIRFVATRFLLAIVTLLLVTFIVYSLMELSPVQFTDRCWENVAGTWQIVPRHEFFVIRWLNWVSGIFLRADFGYACVGRTHINALLGVKFWISLGICLSSLLIAYLIAIPVGIYSVVSPRLRLNNMLRIFSYLGLAIPNFLVAIIVLLVWSNLFGETLTGLFSREYQGAAWSVAKFVDFLAHAWLPVLVLGWSATAFAVMSVRALVFDEYHKQYVMAARARGVSGRQLIWRYPVRHAMGPIVNSLGFDLNRVFNELPIVAFILAITDAGNLLLQALLRSNDQELAAAILFLLGASIIALNFCTDILLAMLDPRFRRSLMG